MIGETLGSYRIVDRLGAGGMGEVYLAQHTRIERRAAIKVLLPELSSNQEVVERFFSEARATSSIRHRGIVEVLDCDVHPSGRAYIVMELLEGESLAGRLARDPIFGRDVDRVLAVTGAVADAVAAAHAKGIVHRDLKPDNVFLARDEGAPLGFEVKILDFGIAKLMGGGESKDGHGSMRTRTGSLLGTPAYMSPEQCRGASLVDHRTDIYSLGCIVFEMLAGRRPFMYEGFGELISAHLTETPPGLASLGVEVSPDVEAFTQRLLAKSPKDRFASMSEVSAAARALRHRTTAVLPSAGATPSATGTAVLSPGAGLPALRTPPPGAGPSKTPSAGGTMMLPTGGAPGRAPAPPAMTTLSAHAAEAESVGRSAPPVGKWALIGVGAAAVVGGALFFARSSGPAPTPAAPSPVVAATPTPAAPPPAAREPEPVTVGVSDAPEGLRAWVDGAPSALPLRLPAGSQTHEVLFRAPGFQDRTMRVDGSSSRTLTLALEPTTPARGAAGAGKAAGGGHAPAAAPADHGGEEHKHHTHHPAGGGGLTDDARKL
jgi:serine/threonine-protein kinase